MNNLEKLLYLRGISADYYSYSGDLIPVSWQDRLQLLREVGDDPDDENAIDAAIYKLDARPWQSWLQALQIMLKGSTEYLDIRVSPDQLQHEFQWKITTEQGAIIDGKFTPAALEEVGNYFIDDVRYSAHRLVITDLPLGYHQILLEYYDKQQKALLIVAPDCCFKGDFQDQKVWGINCQLYTLRSTRNWGIGDFTDLQELIELAAAAGLDLISLNPMHAPSTLEMEIASPYSPSDRRFLNPLYIDPTAVIEFNDSIVLHNQSTEQLKQQLSSLRKLDLIDYEAVAQLKYCVFDQMYQNFKESQVKRKTERATAFKNYVRQQGQTLSDFACFESQHFGFQIQSGSDPEFHQYLQWLAEDQLSNCQQLAKRVGMRIGLMKDLAVGAVRSGAEVQGNPGLFCQNASIGAPPDPLAEQGQNWDLPAIDPTALKESNYQLFIDLLRANMSSCGGLRIDHILGLMRLWWCLPNIENGAYVYYPLDDLLAILSLESQRQCCLVVGEDMGTVPNALRQSMGSKSIYSNKLFYFEKQHGQGFKSPQSHQRDALLMVTNHDVPTLAGWWDGADLLIRKDIGLMESDQQLINAQATRRHEKHELLGWLQSQQLLPASWDISSLEKKFDFDLCSAILIANANSHSHIMLMQLDDLQLLQKPVNIPGTYREYPNWQRKQQQTTKSLFKDPGIQSLLASIHQVRAQ